MSAMSSLFRFSFRALCEHACNKLDGRARWGWFWLRQGRLRDAWFSFREGVPF